jgi:hypothetical protein
VYKTKQTPLTRRPDGRTRNGSRGGGRPDDDADLAAGEDCPDISMCCICILSMVDGGWWMVRMGDYCLSKKI